MDRKASFASFFSLMIVTVLFSAGCPFAPATYDVAFEQTPPSDATMGSELNPAGIFPAHQAADLFTLPAGRETIDRVEWWGLYEPEFGPEYRFIVRIYIENTEDRPETFPLYSIPVGAGNPQPSSIANVRAYSANVPSIHLEAGANYYLSILNDNYDWSWYWSCAASDAPTPCFTRNGEGTTWLSGTYDLAFRLLQKR